MANPRVPESAIEKTASNGTGALTLLGAVVGKETINAAVGVGPSCYYEIRHAPGIDGLPRNGQWERGVGHLSSATVFVRDSVDESSSGDALVSFDSGYKLVEVLLAAATPADVTDAVATHEAAGNPHPQYLTEAEGDAAYEPLGGGGGLPVADTTAIVKGSGDPTKLLRFEVDGLSTATTRVLTAQDQDGTLALLSDIAAHEAAGNPHPIYLTQAEGDALYGLPVTDTMAIVKGSGVASKLLRFEVDGFSNDVTRVLTPPDQNGTIAVLERAQTFTLPQAITNNSSAGDTLSITATSFDCTLRITAVGSVNPQIVMVSGTTRVNDIIFNDGADAGALRYRHATDTMEFHTGTFGTPDLELQGDRLLGNYFVTKSIAAIADGDLGTSQGTWHWQDTVGDSRPVFKGKDSAGTVVTFEPGGIGGVSDGDKGDITVSSSGTVWAIDPDAVTYAKIQDVSATDKLLGRSTAGAGDVEEITCTAAGRALLDDANAAAQRSTLGAQAQDADLDQLAALTTLGVLLRTAGGIIVVEPPHVFHGRLTTESGIWVSPSDRTGQANLYVTHGRLGNTARIYDGTEWIYRTFPELTLTLSGLTSGLNYPVFCYYKNGAVKHGLGPAWSTDINRGSGAGTGQLDNFTGVLVNLYEITMLISGDVVPLRQAILIGDVRATSTTTVEDSNAKRFVVNLYNQKQRRAVKSMGSSSHTYGSATVRQYNADTAAQCEFLCSTIDDAVDATLTGLITTVATSNPRLGVGVNATNSHGLYFNSTNVGTLEIAISAPIMPRLGWNFFTLTESNATGLGLPTFDVGIVRVKVLM